MELDPTPEGQRPDIYSHRAIGPITVPTAITLHLTNINKITYNHNLNLSRDTSHLKPHTVNHLGETNLKKQGGYFAH
jgi:hypothetical protein